MQYGNLVEIFTNRYGNMLFTLLENLENPEDIYLNCV